MKLVAIAGRKGSGKDTLALALQKPWGFEVNSPIVAEAFANGIKYICAEHLAVPVEILWGTQADKESFTVLGMSVRTLLQRLGTEALRNQIHPMIHCHMLEQRMARQHSGFEHFVVSDLRFPNEEEWVHSVSGLVVKLTRAPNSDAHLSEASVDLVQGDVVVPEGLDAEQTLDFVWPKVKEYLQQ